MELNGNRKRWKVDRITKVSKPNWLCPTCGIGELLFGEKWARREKNSFTKMEDADYFSQVPDDQVEHFAAIIECSNPDCKEAVSFCGWVEYVREDDWSDKTYRIYHPKFFYPALAIFKVSSNCPAPIKKQIEKSFSHYFNDSSACANSIRTALEQIMDEQGVPKTFINKKHKRENYTLHKRIEEFGKTNSELKPFLLAAKWTGNAGSHVADISKDSLLDGYELLEHCIYELYEKNVMMKALKKKATAINKRKKPISSKQNK